MVRVKDFLFKIEFAIWFYIYDNTEKFRKQVESLIYKINEKL